MSVCLSVCLSIYLSTSPLSICISPCVLVSLLREFDYDVCLHSKDGLDVERGDETVTNRIERQRLLQQHELSCLLMKERRGNASISIIPMLAAAAATGACRLRS